MLHPDEVNAILAQPTVDAPNVSEADEIRVHAMVNALQVAIGPDAFRLVIIQLAKNAEAQLRATHPDCTALALLDEYRLTGR